MAAACPFSNEPAAEMGLQERYRVGNLLTFALDASTQLVYVPHVHAAYVLLAQDVEAARACVEFKTADVHAQSIGAGLATTDAGGRQAIIERLAGLGILMPFSEFERRCAEPLAAAEHRPPSISWLAIPTRNRPVLLTRALESYIANSRWFGRRLSFAVADDSPSAGAREDCRQRLRGMSARDHVPVCYAGREEKLDFCRALANRGDIPEDVIWFGLFGAPGDEATFGANRNAILLHTAGAILLSADDDTVCRPACVKGAGDQHRLRAGNHGDPRGCWFFRDRATALLAAEECHFDIAAEHEKMLGAPLGSAIHSALERAAIDLTSMCDHLLASVAAGQGRIRLTLNGILGDSGMYGGKIATVCAQKETRDRLLSSDARYHEAQTTREVIYQAPVMTISHAGPFMSTTFGLDNRELLPPFFPSYRNEDAVFGQALARIIEHSYAAEMPWTLLHAPAEQRANCTRELSEVRISDVISALLLSWSEAHAHKEPADRLVAIGRYLTALGRLPQQDFNEIVRVLLWNRAAGSIRYLESLIQENGPGASQAWREDVQSLIKALREAMPKSGYSLPTDLLRRFPADQVPEMTRKYVHDFGRLMSWWPAILERTRELRSEGVGVAVPLD